VSQKTSAEQEESIYDHPRGAKIKHVYIPIIQYYCGVSDKMYRRLLVTIECLLYSRCSC